MPASTPAQRLVVIAAYAGQPDPVAGVLSQLPPGFPAATVVALDREADLPALLEAAARLGVRLPLRAVAAEALLEPGIVYVLPADRPAEIVDGVVRFGPADAGGPAPSLDRLLATAAASAGERLIAVLPAGGAPHRFTVGHLVRAHGGMVIVAQLPPDAAGDATPSPSPSSGAVDLLADLKDVGPVLADMVADDLGASPGEPTADVSALLDDIGRHAGIDFRGYKVSTIRRRLRRRLSLTGTATVADYHMYLRTHPQEYEHLTTALLIKVTEFFRDPELFAYLRDSVMPDVIAYARSHGHAIRLWSAGCATGEEAYSLAIILCEALGSELDRFDVRIFATDVDADAVAFARRGAYPTAAVAHLDPDLVARHFVEEDGRYRVAKRLRNLLIFGQHDLGQRPPFPNIDLILCRNVLIYFAKALQDRALRLFTFSLHDGGYLVLGKAEIATSPASNLDLQEATLKVYRRRRGAVVVPPAPTSVVRRRTLGDAGRRNPTADRAFAHDSIARRRAGPSRRVPTGHEYDALLRLPVGVTVVSATYEVRYLNLAARQLLAIHSRAVGRDLVHIAAGAPPRTLGDAIDRALRTDDVVRVAEMEVHDPISGAERQVDLACVGYSPAADGGLAQERLVIVILVDATAHAERVRLLSAGLAEERAARETFEQATVRLRVGVEQLESANRDLAELNTVLQAANQVAAANAEDVQAASEESETLNEELQASNEELETLNEELQATVEELNAANEDLSTRTLELQDVVAARERQQEELEESHSLLEVVLDSLGTALVVVDPAGRPILSNLAYREFATDLEEGVLTDLDGEPVPPHQRAEQRAARGEAFTTAFTIVNRAGGRRWFEAIGQPLRADRRIEGREPPTGGVVAIRDMTDRTLRRLQDEFLATASHELRTPITAISMYTGLLKRLIGPTGADAQIGRMLDELVLEARRMSLLVNDLMDTERIKTGQVKLSRQRMDLGAVLARAVEVARHLGKGQEVRLDAPAGETAVVGDPNRLEQVLVNLLENAIVHGGGQGTVEVRLRTTESSVEVEIQDHGPGIAAEDLPNVFDRFFRSRESARRAAGGVGVGLYISNQLVIGHGGRITVRSTEGEGATFTVRLPLADPADPTAADREPSP